MEVINSDLLGLITTNPELSLIPIALLFGMILKKSKVNDGLIPVIVIVLSAVIAFLINGMDVTAVIKGIVAGSIAVAGVTSVKQAAKVSEEE